MAQEKLGAAIEVEAQNPASLSSIRFRAVLIGSLLLFPNAYWVIHTEKVRPGPYPTIISLFLNVVLWLIVLLLVNQVLKRVVPRWQFRPAELLLMYTMLCIGSAFAGHDMTPILVQMMAHPYFYVSEFPVWRETVLPNIPPALTVPNPSALRGYFIGNSTLYRWEHLSAWIPPLALWLLFIGMLWWTMLCIVSLVRAQWTESERLAYPLVELPLRMVDPSGALWRARLFWAGVAVSGSIDLLNGLNYWFPSLPAIPVKHQNIGYLFANRPWNAIGWFPISFYPLAIGIGYLLPLDLLFSCWFFFLYWKLQSVVVVALGWDIVPEFPFIREQGFGAYMGIGTFLLLSGRGMIRKIVHHLRHPEQSDLNDSTEAMPYRMAVWGLIGGVVGMVLFLTYFGMRWQWALTAILIYLMISFVITRIRAELGPPVHDQHFSGPDTLLPKLLGTQAFHERDMGMLNFFYWFNRAYRSHPMPFALEGLKMASVVRASIPTYFWVMLWAGLLGSVAGFWAYLHQAYALGTSAGFHFGRVFGQEPSDRLHRWLSMPTMANPYAQLATGFGFLVALGLMWLRSVIPGFAFHPIGFAISGSWSMHLVWLPLMIAWAIKWAILRFGGLRTYRQGIPFFLGLIVGQAVVGLGWSLIGIVFDIPTYSFWGE